jgi:hypothetical protein
MVAACLGLRGVRRLLRGTGTANGSCSSRGVGVGRAWWWSIDDDDGEAAACRGGSEEGGCADAE